MDEKADRPPEIITDSSNERKLEFIHEFGQTLWKNGGGDDAARASYKRWKGRYLPKAPTPQFEEATSQWKRTIKRWLEGGALQEAVTGILNKIYDDPDQKEINSDDIVALIWERKREEISILIDRLAKIIASHTFSYSREGELKELSDFLHNIMTDIYCHPGHPAPLILSPARFF